MEMNEVAQDFEAMKKINTVDTVHQDEAVRVLQSYGGDNEWTEAEENKLRRKLDLKLMIPLCATYGLQYYDKAMLSQAVWLAPSCSIQAAPLTVYRRSLGFERTFS